MKDIWKLFRVIYIYIYIYIYLLLSSSIGKLIELWIVSPRKILIL